MSGVGKMVTYLKKTEKTHKGEVVSETLREVYLDNWNDEVRYFFVGELVYVPASHLNRDFITTENIIRWELATLQDVAEHQIN